MGGLCLYLVLFDGVDPGCLRIHIQLCCMPYPLWKIEKESGQNGSESVTPDRGYGVRGISGSVGAAIKTQGLQSIPGIQPWRDCM
jgi:hypothetical protein